MRHFFWLIIIALLGFSCKTTQKIALPNKQAVVEPTPKIPPPQETSVRKIPVHKDALQKNSYEIMLDTSVIFSQSFTGFSLYDLEKKQLVFERNANRNFTPASNVKLYTLYTALKTLGDSIPALKYSIRNDSLIFWGTGDPTFLHPDITNTSVLDFLKQQAKTKKLYFSDINFTNQFYNTGWAWDDYNDDYQPEISPLPMYGNYVKVIIKDANKIITPNYFQNNFFVSKTDRNYIKRTLYENTFDLPITILQKAIYQQLIPFKTSSVLTQQLLKDALQSNVEVIKMPLLKDFKTLYSGKIEPVYRQMMQESDDLFAEQLLLLCGSTLKDSLNSSFAIDYSLKNYLQDLPDVPRWVDGSGLSRYNLFTPRATIKLLEKLYATLPQEKLFSILAIGGQAGTIRNLFKAEKPFVFGKTGSMGGVYNLSGYLVTKTGKVLLFSFMNNNFTRRTGDIRKEVEKILTWIHENY